MDKKRIIAWWSGGIASAVACQLTLDQYGESHNVEIVFIDTRNEHEDTYRFLYDCEKHYGQKIITLASEKWSSIEEVWRTRLSLNIAGAGAICSSELKRRERIKYQNPRKDFGQIFGFDFTPSELKRAENMTKNYPEINPLYPLIEHQYTKEMCIQAVQSWGVELPWAYRAGFRNNNCFRTGCVQGGIGYWQKLQAEYPDTFKRMSDMEKELTAIKGEPVTVLKNQEGGKRTRLFLEPHEDYPEIKHLAQKKGRPVEPLMECNGFCTTEEPEEDLFAQLLQDFKDMK